MWYASGESRISIHEEIKENLYPYGPGKGSIFLCTFLNLVFPFEVISFNLSLFFTIMYVILLSSSNWTYEPFAIV